MEYYMKMGWYRYGMGWGKRCLGLDLICLGSGILRFLGMMSVVCAQYSTTLHEFLFFIFIYLNFHTHPPQSIQARQLPRRQLM